MPQMELIPYNGGTNAELLDAVRGTLDPAYQSRVPDATRAGLNAVMNAMNSYSPAMNAFMDGLINLIGAQIVKYNSWTNPLAVYKQGLLNSGESIEEINIGLLKAHVYKPEADPTLAELFGQEKPPIETVFHKVNRQEWYKVSVNESQLERAFLQGLNSSGLSTFIAGMMASINTSDNEDEFLETASTLRRYYDGGGFFKLAVPDINKLSATQNDAQQFLRQVRATAETLPFISTRYNSRHMPMSSTPDDLMLMMTPEGKATLDVTALSAAFNIDKAGINQRITTMPAEYFGIPGCQGILTTKRFWVLADKKMQMGTVQNPVGLFNNYIWHHQEVISASPFENAILLSSTESDTIAINTYQVVGLTPFVVTDLVSNAPITVTSQNTSTVNGIAAADGGTVTLTRGRAYVVALSAITQPVGGPTDAVTLRVSGRTSTGTHVNQYGILVIAQDENASALSVQAIATDDNTTQSNLVITLTGSLVAGSVGLTVDDNPNAIANRRKPYITGTPTVGNVLTVTHGVWDTSDIEFTYQWTRDGTNISGATAQEYTAVTADATHNVACTLVASRTGYTTSSPVTTNAVAVTA